MAFGKSSSKPYTTKTSTTTTINGESATKYKLKKNFWLLSVLLLVPALILLFLAATGGKHNFWPFNRVWLAEGDMNMERQASVLSVANKFSDLVSTVLPAAFPNLGIPLSMLKLSQNGMKLFASKDTNVLSQAGVPQNQWDNVQNMYIKFNNDESQLVYPTKDSKGVDIGPFKNNVLNYNVAGHKVRSYFSAFKWMFHINWILVLLIIILICLAQFKFRETNVRKFCITYVIILLLLFMIFFFNLVMYIVMNFGVNGITDFLNRITVGAIPNAVTEFLGQRNGTLTEPMFSARSSSMRKLVLAALILLFLAFLLVLAEVIYMLLSLPNRIPKTTTTKTVTKRIIKKNQNGDEYGIDIADGREY